MSITPEAKTVDVNTKRVTLADYALRLHQHGFNVVPMLSNRKSPALETWADLCKQRQTEDDIRSLKWSRNIGIVNGINGMRTIDIDQCDSTDFLFKVLQLLGLNHEYQWIVQSPGGGFHIHIICANALKLTNNGVLVGDPLPGNEFKQIELRWSDCVTMFPHSIHPETHKPYKWLFGAPQIQMATIPLTIVESAFKAVATIQKKTKQEATHTTNSTEKKIIKFDAWAQKALDQEISIMRSAGEGQRNTQLNRSAFSLGQIVGAGLLDAKIVEGELNRAANAVGLDEEETMATIKSGLEAGIKKPRMPRQVFKNNEPPLKLPIIKNIDDAKIASFTADDQGHAECVYDLYGPYIAYNEAYGWMVWNGSHYSTSIQRINTLIVEVIRLRMKAAAHLERSDLAKVSKSMAGTVNATRSMLENLAFIHVDEFDAEPDLINVKNGIINLRNGKMLPHDPTYRFTWCSPIAYNPKADKSFWVKFLEDTVNEVEIVKYIQKSLGYSITGHTIEECLFYIFGPPRSGKGTVCEAILAIFPRPICTEVDFNSFTQKREGDSQNFDLAPLKAARIVFASESNKYQSLNPAKIKALTGGNLVYCAHKYGAFFNYKPQYAVWLSSNHEVNGDADDDALWGRLKVVGFPNSRLGSEDKSLKAYIQSTEILESILLWLIEGAYEWYQMEGKGLETPKSVKELTATQRAGQDSVGLWIDECCELEAEGWVSNNMIRISYENWCEANGYKPKEAKGLSQSLAAHGLQIGVVKRTSDELKSKTMRGVSGITI